jgi:hypothetical protein
VYCRKNIGGRYKADGQYVDKRICNSDVVPKNMGMDRGANAVVLYVNKRICNSYAVPKNRGLQTRTAVLIKCTDGGIRKKSVIQMRF